MLLPRHSVRSADSGAKSQLCENEVGCISCFQCYLASTEKASTHALSPISIQPIIGAKDTAGSPPAGLELEITESLIVEDIKHNIASLEPILREGVS
jgi:hypothetical protein